MDISVKASYFVIDLILPLVVGYFCRFQNRLGEDFFNRMIVVNILIIYPILSVLSFWNMRLDFELIWLPVLGIVMSIIPGLFAFPWAKKKYANRIDQGSYILAAILSNILTLGGLAVFILYGEVGYAYTQLVVLFGNVILFMFCYPLAQYFYQSGQKESGNKISLISVLFNRNQLPVLGLLFGVILYYSEIPRPAVLGNLFDPFVHIGAWTALIPVGYSMDFTEMKKYWRGTADLIFIKFVATPILTYAFARLFISDTIILNTIIILASTPTAINTVITVKIHNLNINIAMASFVLTTAVFLLVVYPIIFVVLSM